MQMKWSLNWDLSPDVFYTYPYKIAQENHSIFAFVTDNLRITMTMAEGPAGDLRLN